jgi:hypothetical protein
VLRHRRVVRPVVVAALRVLEGFDGSAAARSPLPDRRRSATPVVSAAVPIGTDPGDPGRPA